MTKMAHRRPPIEFEEAAKMIRLFDTEEDLTLKLIAIRFNRTVHQVGRVLREAGRNTTRGRGPRI